MKKILLLLTLISFSCIAQNNPAYHRSGARMPFIQLDTITTTERDALTIPSSASSIIYNSTVDSVQYKIPSGGWKSFGAGGASGVPYTGATTDVDLGDNNLTSQFLYSEGQPSGNTAGALLLRYDTAITSPLNYVSLSASSQYRFRITTDDSGKGVMFDMSGITAFSPRILTIPDLSGTIALTSQITGTNSGTNTGDQTSIVGITGTKAEFDTAVTDGDILYVGDVTTNATHTGEVTGATALTIASGVVDSDNIVNGTIDEVDLDASVNASLDKADSAVQSDGTGRTAATEYTNLYGQTQAGYTTDGAPAAGTLVFITDASPADSFTGTVIPLDSYYQNDNSATDTATWTLAASPKNGALVEILINMASEPAITGATQFSNSPAFISDTPMILTVKHILGTTYYFFTEL